MGEIWLGAGMEPRPRQDTAMANDVNTLQMRVRDLEHQVGRLSLMCQALWELLRERAKLSDEQLQERAKEIDLRDGVADGAISGGAVRCPSCGRVSNQKHYRCLYCGQEFERPAMA